MDEQTRKLLEECSSGCKMAVNSMEQGSVFMNFKKGKEGGGWVCGAEAGGKKKR